MIAREWHDNMLQLDQVAKFYYEEVNLDWLGKIQFDVIIAVANHNLVALGGERTRI